MRNFIFIYLFFTSYICFSQVGIGTTNPKATLDVKSESSGILIPRMNTASRLGLVVTADQNGMMVYDTDTKTFWYYDNNAPNWIELSEAKFVNGTTSTDAVYTSGSVGIGTTSPNISAKFQVTATDKGILLPQVNLTGINDTSTISTPAKSLLVWNTGTTWGESAFYYNRGTDTSPIWTKLNYSDAANNLDVGYIVGWAANTTPPDFLLPLNGGTYNKSDFPDLMNMHTSHTNQFISSETATTFTLKNVNGDERFLRGSTNAGIDQAMSTAQPTTSFITNNTGTHTHSVDPPNTTTTSGGSHTHSVDPPNTTTTTNGNHRHSITTKNSGTGTSNIVGNNNSATSNNTKNTNYAGNHTHTVNIPSFNSASNGNHSHTVNIAAFNSANSGNHAHTVTGGGDAETRPINTSVVWCLKAKSTSNAGALTINNTTQNITNNYNAGEGISISNNTISVTGVEFASFELSSDATLSNGGFIGAGGLWQKITTQPSEGGLTASIDGVTGFTTGGIYKATFVYDFASNGADFTNYQVEYGTNISKLHIARVVNRAANGGTQQTVIHTFVGNSSTDLKIKTVSSDASHTGRAESTGTYLFIERIR